MTPTLYTFGYFGWGNATTQLVQAVDAVEASRGFEPPLFVDTRIRRSVRAAGFNGSAFQKLLGPQRYRWMKSLGNKFIETRTGPPIQIADPASAATLLDIALEASEKRQRILFFCGCQYPRQEGKTVCHRATIAGLVLEAARQKDQPIEIIEWPGGEPQARELEAAPTVFKALRGRATIPLPAAAAASLAGWSGLPWGSIVTVRCEDRSMRVVSGPAGCHGGEWVLPIFHIAADAETPLAAIEQEAANLRRSLGLDKQQSLSSERA
jgi:hypothetical protein